MGMMGYAAYTYLKKADVIEVDLLPRQSPKGTSKSRQIVSQPDLSELERKVELLQQKALLLSQKTTRVQQQQVAQMTGQTQNRLPKSLAPVNALKKMNKTIDTPHYKEKSKDGFEDEQKEISKETRELMEQEMDLLSHAPVGISTINDHIPNVKKGLFTSLNTDQFTYYTFFQRINEQLRPRWEDYIQAAQAAMSQNQILMAARRPRVSNIEVVINSKGDLVESRLHKSSGTPPLDFAAIKAFEQIAPILNPPKGMISQDGNIHLYYSFRVELAER